MRIHAVDLVSEWLDAFETNNQVINDIQQELFSFAMEREDNFEPYTRARTQILQNDCAFTPDVALQLLAIKSKEVDIKLPDFINELIVKEVFTKARIPVDKHLVNLVVGHDKQDELIMILKLVTERHEDTYGIGTETSLLDRQFRSLIAKPEPMNAFAAMIQEEEERIASHAIQKENEMKALEASRSDQAFMLEEIRKNFTNFMHVSDSLKQDEAFVLKVIEINPHAFWYAADTLKANPQFILNALNITDNDYILQCASFNLIDDPNFMLQVLSKEKWNRFSYASKRLRDDPDFILAVFHKLGDSHFLYNVSDHLRDDGEFMLKMIELDPIAVRVASSRLKTDPEFKGMVSQLGNDGQGNTNKREVEKTPFELAQVMQRFKKSYPSDSDSTDEQSHSMNLKK